VEVVGVDRVVVVTTVVVVGLVVDGRTVVVVVDVVDRVVVDPVSPSSTSWHVARRHSSGDRQTFLPTFLIAEFSMHSVNRL
jgi:hypothetical protein